jgi:membrane fusion protein (multidrug efflux system)
MGMHSFEDSPESAYSVKSAPAGTAAARAGPERGEQKRKRNLKPWIVTILCVVGAVILLVGIKGAQIGAMIHAGKTFVPPPESVSSATAKTVEWEASRAAIGSLVAMRGVTLAAELAGTVREITFDSGTSVQKGAVLVRLDTSIEEAQLEAAQAEAALAKISLERAQSLRRGGSSSPADLDAADAKAKQADANVAMLRATIAKKTVRAPFDGRIGIRQIELGQVLSPGTPIASLQSVDPIYAEFSLPQEVISHLTLGQSALLQTDAFPGGKWDGKITTINSEVDVATRSVRVRATFPNRDGRLRPGMFANVDVVAPQKQSVLIVPATAIVYAPYGDSVYVLAPEKDAAGKEKTVAHQRFVRLGERQGDFVEVTAGLKAGETVVGSGAFKLRNGAAVAVNDALAPKPEFAPSPSDR